MKDIKFEFDRLEVVYPAKDINKMINNRFDSGKDFTIEEAIKFWRPIHDLEILNFAGQNGWEIRSVINKKSTDGEIEIYYLQRESIHSNFGKLTLREEYQKSELYKKHKSMIDKMKTRQNKK